VILRYNELEVSKEQNMADTIKESIAELIGKKSAELKVQPGISPVREWRTYLEGQGYTVENRDSSANITERHIVLYTANDGSVQATLSDSQAANSIKPIGRMTITKSSQAKSTKAGDSKGA
jgi:hypothetical protein